MTVEQFIEFFEKLLISNKQAFIANTNHLRITDKTPHEWTELFVKWSELANEEDARRHYSEYYK